MALPTPEEYFANKNREGRSKLPAPEDILPEYASQLKARNVRIDTGRQAMAPLATNKPNILPAVPNSMNTQPLSMSAPLQRTAQAKPVAPTPVPAPNLRETVQPVSMGDGLVRNHTSVSTPSSRREQFVEDRVAQDRQAVEGNKILSGINKALEPVSRAIYSATSASPIAAFQQGAGQALGIKPQDITSAPVEDNLSSKIGTLAGQIVGPFANPLGTVGGLGNGLLGAGRGFSQEVGRTLPIASSRLGRAATEGAAIGAIEGGYASALQGDDLQGIASNVAIGGALGAAGDAALTGIAQGIRGARSATNVPQSNTAPQTPSQLPPLPQAVQRSNTEAIKQAPNLNEPWFEKLFGRGGVGITAGKGNSKELIDTHITKNAKAPVPVIERMKDAATVANQDYIDRFAPLAKISQESYDAAMDSTKGNNLANVAVKDKFVDLEGNVIGGSLKDNYSVVPRVGNDLAERYVVMRDAIDRMDRGIKVYGEEPWYPKTSQEAADRVAEMEQQYPWLKDFGSQWNEYTANSRKLAVDSGLMSQELSDILERSNPNYTPMNRQLSGVKSNAFRSNKDSLSGQKHGVKRAKGGTQKIIEPAQSRINATSNLYNAALRNKAMQKIYDAVLADPDRFEGVIEIVPTTDSAKQITLKQINEAIERDGVDGIAEFLNDEANTLFTKGKQQSARANDNFVTVMIDGDPVKMNVKELGVLRAIEGITPESLSGVLKTIDFLSRGVKQSATGALAPVQGVKLFLRDIPLAFGQSKDKLHFMQDISQALVSQAADWLPDFVPGAQNLAKLAREYYRAGGGYEQYLRGDSRIRATASDIKKSPLLSVDNLKKQVRTTGLGLRPLKELGDAFENIPRIAAFQASMRKNGWKRDEATIREALRDAREATVNWSRKGGKGQQIESLLPYSNAAVQGTYRMAKFMKEQPVSAMAFIMGVTGATIGAYEKFKDDPDYKHRSKFAQGIPVYKTKDGKFVTIPTEPAYQYISDQVLNFYKWAKDQEELPNAGEAIQEGLDAFTPKYIAGPASILTTPSEDNRLATAAAKTVGGSSLEPLLAAAYKKNFFGGDIVPREYQGRSISEQKDATTSAAANWAAENLGMDAFTFDYIAEKFGGDLAKVLLPMTSDVGKGDPTGDIVNQTLARLKLLEDPVMNNNLSNEYYKYVDKVSRAKADGTELPSWYQDVYDNVTSTKKGSIASQLSELNKQKKEIQRDVTLTAKQRSEQLRSVQTGINLLRIEGIRIMEQAGVMD